MELFISIFFEGLIGSLKNILTIMMIVIPLMISLEVAKDLNILDKINNIFYPAAKLFKISKEATFPLIVGLIFGLSYGAGVIIKYAQEGKLTNRELIIVNTFLAVAHALVEDTLLLMAVGASGTFLVVSRMILAILITVVIAYYIPEDKGVNILLNKQGKQTVDS